MAPFQFDYAPTPTDEHSSVTDRSWKSVEDVHVREDVVQNQGDKKSRFWAWWSRPQKQEPESQANWKPLSMTTPILLAVIAASVLMVAAIELLAQKSQKQGGLALSPSLDEIPQYAMITSQYVPQILAVCYSLVWSWIDLDVKRMQPWFEMSKPEGALAQDSLFLDYPYTFVAWVPFVAARRKHWLVLLSGTAMVIVFWAITPLQSAQIGTGAVNQTKPHSIVNRSSLAPLPEQQDLLGPKILNTGYSIAWLGQPYPPFMTPDEAFLPFYLNKKAISMTQGPNFTATTTKLSTDLDCWPAEISREGARETNTFSFLNGQGCNATIQIPPDKNYTMLYVGYYDSPYSSYALQSPTCRPTKNSTHQFLAVWAMPYPNRHPFPGWEDLVYDFKLVGMYCQTNYFKQEVMISVDLETLKPYERSLEPVSEREKLSETEFNSTAFEFLIGNGMSEKIKERDHPFSFVVEQYSRVDNDNLTRPISNMVGFALSGRGRPISEYSNREALQEIYSRAHRFLFSVAVDGVLINHTDFNNRTATVTSRLSGIVVSRPISAALEALLLLLSVFTAIILWLCRASYSNLHVNPSSISRTVDIFRNSPHLLDLFSSMDNADEKSLAEATKNNRFRLIWNQRQECPELSVEAEPEASIERERRVVVPKGFYEPVRPFVLRAGSGVTFITAVVGVVAGLAYLKWAEVEYSGLRRPSPNREVQQILENYIPTILSTLIEPFWVLVNRLLCVFQPFKDLWEGKAKPENSLAATYTSIPPQFVIWRALKSRHFFLSVICGAVFLANVLTVSLPAIFNADERVIAYSETFHPQVAATFNNESVFGFSKYLSSHMISSSRYQDHAYSALSNITLGTSLPPWVTEDYFFQPWQHTRDDKAASYSLLTRGFGVKTNCTSVAPFVLPLMPQIQPVENPNTSFCGDLLDIVGSQMRYSQATLSSGPSANEHCGTLTGGTVAQCDKTLTLGWGRTPQGNNTNATIEASFAICRPSFETAMFEVEVDFEGYILSSQRRSEFKSTLDEPESDVQIEMLIAQSNNIIGLGSTGWHNDTLTRDWMTHFIVATTGSRAILDPGEPAPNPEELLPLVDGIYRKLFAILLGFNHHLFNDAKADDTMEGKRLVKETRLFIDQPAFIISMTLMGINIAIAAVFYLRSTAFVLPRMPTTVGSLIAYIAPSRMVEEPTTIQQNRTFSFGRFIGRDGESHIGIEIDPYVVLIHPTSFGKRGKWWSCFNCSRNSGGPQSNEAWL